MRVWRIVVCALLGAFFLVLISGLNDAEANLKYKKETGKKCTFCHSEVPDPGDEDPRLTEDGKKFKENGYKLTEEQKKKPD